MPRRLGPGSVGLQERPAHHPGRTPAAAAPARRAAAVLERPPRRHVDRRPAARAARVPGALEAAGPVLDATAPLKPGITGWAQIRAGYAADALGTLEKLSYDLWYLRHRSCALDAVICLKTFPRMITFGGAALERPVRNLAVSVDSWSRSAHGYLSTCQRTSASRSRLPNCGHTNARASKPVTTARGRGRSAPAGAARRGRRRREVLRYGERSRRTCESLRLISRRRSFATTTR